MATKTDKILARKWESIHRRRLTRNGCACCHTYRRSIFEKAPNRAERRLANIKEK